jgi:hypothetical protein
MNLFYEADFSRASTTNQQQRSQNCHFSILSVGGTRVCVSAFTVIFPPTEHLLGGIKQREWRDQHMYYSVKRNSPRLSECWVYVRWWRSAHKTQHTLYICITARSTSNLYICMVDERKIRVRNLKQLA